METVQKFKYKGVRDSDSNLKTKWITDGFIDDGPIEWARAFAEHLVSENKNNSLDYLKDRDGNPRKDNWGKILFRKKLSTSQIRKFFGELKNIEANTSSTNFNLGKVKMIKPKLAYAVGREKSPEPKIADMYFEFSRAIDAISEYKHFKNFVQLFEATVAYHKLYENH